VDDIDRLLDLLGLIAEGVLAMSDEEVEAELAGFKDDKGLNVGEIIARALARNKPR